MKRKNKEGKLFLGILIAVVTLGIGYALVTGVDLMINGSAKAIASGSQEDFIVHFDDLVSTGNYITYIETAGVDSFTQSFDNANHVTASSSTTTKAAGITIANDKLSADVSVSNMTTIGDTVTLVIPVINESDGINADLSVVVENNSEEFFTVTATPGVETLNGGNATTVTVTVSVIKVPKVNDVNGTFTVTLTADPAE